MLVPIPSSVRPSGLRLPTGARISFLAVSDFILSALNVVTCKPIQTCRPKWVAHYLAPPPARRRRNNTMRPSATKTMTRLITFARAANRQGSIATRSIAVQQLGHTRTILSSPVQQRRCREKSPVDRRSLSIAAIIKTVPECIPVPISARGTIGNCTRVTRRWPLTHETP